MTKMKIVDDRDPHNYPLRWLYWKVAKLYEQVPWSLRVLPIITVIGFIVWDEPFFHSYSHIGEAVWMIFSISAVASWGLYIVGRLSLMEGMWKQWIGVSVVVGSVGISYIYSVVVASTESGLAVLQTVSQTLLTGMVFGGLLLSFLFAVSYSAVVFIYVWARLTNGGTPREKNTF